MILKRNRKFIKSKRRVKRLYWIPNLSAQDILNRS